MKTIFLALIRAYQYALRPMLGSNCRFYPSCSDYAREAIEKHGALRGLWLAVAPRRPLPPVSSRGLRPRSLAIPTRRARQARGKQRPAMDTRRIILFVIFSFSVLFLWQAWQQEHAPPPAAEGRRGPGAGRDAVRRAREGPAGADGPAGGAGRTGHGRGRPDPGRRAGRAGRPDGHDHAPTSTRPRSTRWAA